MQVRLGRRRGAGRLAAVLVTLMAALLAAAVLAGARAQDGSVHRFFGHEGDITLDGRALTADDVITALIGDQEVARTSITPGGVWFLDVNGLEAASSPCGVSFAVNGMRADQVWDTCPTRVRLTLVTSAGDGAAPAPAVGERTASQPAPAGLDGLLSTLLDGDSTWRLAAIVTAVLVVLAASIAWLMSRLTDSTA